MVALIRDDAIMMDGLGQAFNELWRRAVDLPPGSTTSSLLLIPASEIIIALIEMKLELLQDFPRKKEEADRLKSVAKVAAMYIVADTLMEELLPDYIPIRDGHQFDVIDERPPQRDQTRPTKLSAGWWDSMFGELTELEFPQPDGTLKSIPVTKKWLENALRDGQLRPAPDKVVTAHVLAKEICRLTGSPRVVEFQQAWQIGEHISLADYQRARDPSGDLYVLKAVTDQGTKIKCVPKDSWLKSEWKKKAVRMDEL